jgi:hypothetical protein
VDLLGVRRDGDALSPAPRHAEREHCGPNRGNLPVPPNPSTGPLSRTGGYAAGVYAQRFNKVVRRDGHLFSARFWSREINNDTYLKAAVRYVARNPVEAGLCRDAGDWPWSSYSAAVGTTPAPSFFDVRRQLALFDDNESRARGAFRRYVTAKDTEVDAKAATYPSLFETGV